MDSAFGHELMPESSRDFSGELDFMRKSQDEIAQIYSFAASLGINTKNLGIEKVTVNKPDHVLDWSRRVVGLEHKYRKMAGMDLDEIAEEKLRHLAVEPQDIAMGEMTAFQMLSRYVWEIKLAENPLSTVDDLSMLRGGGQHFNVWLNEKLKNLKDSQGKDITNKELTDDELDALSLVRHPATGAMRAMLLLQFFRRFQKINSKPLEEKG